MVLQILFAVGFPAWFAWVQGYQIKNAMVFNQKIFHILTAAVYTVLCVLVTCCVSETDGMYRCELFQYIVLLLSSKIILFDGILNKTIGQDWLYVGHTSWWDKFLRGKIVHLEQLGIIVGIIYFIYKFIGIAVTIVLSWSLLATYYYNMNF